MKLWVNGEEREFDESTAGQLLTSLGIERVGCAVEVNQEVVPKSRLDSHELAAGDRVEIVRLVGGG